MSAAPQVYEVFTQRERGDPHVHVGAVNAADPDMALLMAQYVYGRRDGWTSLWVVPRSAVHRTNEVQEEEFQRMQDRTYRKGDSFNRTAKQRRGVLSDGDQKLQSDLDASAVSDGGGESEAPGESEEAS